MMRAGIDALAKRFGTKVLFEILEAQLTERRRVLIAQRASQRLRSVQVAMEAPCDLHNVLAASRSCEAFGLRTLHIVAAEGKVPRSKKTARGAYRWIEVQRHKDLDTFWRRPDGDDWVYAASDPSAALTLEELPLDRPICLLFGNEERGLSSAARARCQLQYRIPMWGMAESLNLSVSVALSSYEVSKRRRQHLGSDGDLSSEEQELEILWGYIRTLGVEKSIIFLKNGLQVTDIKL